MIPTADRERLFGEFRDSRDSRQPSFVTVPRIDSFAARKETGSGPDRNPATSQNCAGFMCSQIIRKAKAKQFVHRDLTNGGCLKPLFRREHIIN